MRLVLLPILAAGVLGSACNTTSTSTATGSSCFDACLAAGGHVDVSAELEASTDVASALEATRRAFASYLEGATSLGDVADLLAEASSLSLPSGFSYEGNGVYSVGVDGTTSQIRYFWPVPCGDVKVGEPITWDVFDSSNYFEGLSVQTKVDASLSGVDTSLSLSFTKVGPGAALLGLGDAPRSPIEIDLDSMAESLQKTTSDAQVAIDGKAFGAVTSLEVTSAKTALLDFGDAPVALTVDALAGENTSTGQALSLLESSLSLVDSAQAYGGELSFRSASNRFSFDARLRFDGDAEADIRLGCSGAELLFPDELED
jgi:hypothetical protein